MRTMVLVALVAALVGCQMRPYNPLLGKWDSAPPNDGRLLIFNNDGSFVLEAQEGERKIIEEGKYSRQADRVELTFSGSEGAGGRTVGATLEGENRVLRLAFGGIELEFNKR